MQWNIPNSLTVLRILFIPFFVSLYYFDSGLSSHQVNVLATAIFGLAAATDWLDGYFCLLYTSDAADE